MKTKIYLIISLLICCFTSVRAYDFEHNGIYYNIISDKDKTVCVTYKDTKYNSYSGDIVIPKMTINPATSMFYNVVAIGDNAFLICKSLTSVTLSEITSIGDYGFYGCLNLLSINLPKTLTSIGASAFDHSGLSAISIPEGISTLGDNTFKDCSNLSSVTFPNTLTSIGNSVFSGCTSLSEIELPKSLTSLGTSVFCKSGLEKISMQECNIETLSEKTFYQCSNLKSVVLPQTLLSIGTSAFEESGISSITLPQEITSLERKAFMGCTNLESISLPQTLTYIGSHVFKNSSLKNIEFSDNLEVIDSCAFSGCKQLKSLSFPSKLQYLRAEAFKNCGIESVEATSKIILETSVFEGCSSLTNVSIPDLSVVPKNTFKGCSSLMDIAIYSDTHEYVDLGLSVKWATCNIGANKPEEDGKYFVFAHGVEWKKDRLGWKRGRLETSNEIKSHCENLRYERVDSRTYIATIRPEDDAARIHWGGVWRLPTYDELKELRDNTTAIYYKAGNTEFNGVEGYKIQSTKPGYTDKFIFLPKTGTQYILDGHITKNNDIQILSSTVERVDGYYYAGFLLCGSSNGYSLWYSGNMLYDYAGTIRPVCE